MSKTNMEKLKVRFKLNGLEFELEGNEDTVKSELSVFKDFVMNTLIGKVNLTEVPTSSLQSTESQIIQITPANIPLLKEVVMKDLPKTEAEWILVYCYYASKYGKEPFAELDIKKLYEDSKRKNESRMKNFSVNFSKVLNNGFIRVLNEMEYILLQKGIDQAVGILSESSTNTESLSSSEQEYKQLQKRGKKTKVKSNAKSTSFSLVASLNLNPQAQKSLKSFFSEFITKTFLDKNLLFIYYMERILKITDIGINHVYTCYKNVGEKVPGNLYQSLVDTKNLKGWIESKDINNLKITIAGENHVEHDYPRV